MTYYIDPGTSKGCAVARFSPAVPPAGVRQAPGVLRGLGIWSDTDGILKHWGAGIGGAFEPSVWEIPQLYPNELRRSRLAPTKAMGILIAKANDLIALSAAGAACATHLSWGRGGVRAIKPAAWKKQLPKPIHHKAAWRVLTVEERELIVQAYVDTSGMSRERAASAEAHLLAYIEAACREVAKRKEPSYKAAITDLLDAVCLGLSQEGRLVL